MGILGPSTETPTRRKNARFLAARTASLVFRRLPPENEGRKNEGRKEGREEVGTGRARASSSAEQGAIM